jgi:3-hydroxy-3-methylglutaryl CoA synthase
MIGITRWGAYIPYYRLNGQILGQVWGESFTGERAVANYDEDSLTLAAEAIRICLRDEDPKTFQGLYYASTSMPYREHQNATLLATVGDLSTDLFTADFSGSLRASTQAFRAAYDAVKAGSADKILVAASDIRLGEPGSGFEATLGDAGAALAVGKEGVVAEIQAFYSYSQDFLDVWRTEDQRYVKSGDQKFIETYGYRVFIKKALEGLLNKTGLNKTDISRVLFFAPDTRTFQNLSQDLGFKKEVYLPDPLLNVIGCTGTAYPFLLLIAALEMTNPGEKIVLVSYGSGSDAILLEVTENIKSQSGTRILAEQLHRKKNLNQYGKYLRFRKLVQTEQLNPFSSLPVLWREEKQNLRLYGQKCRICGAVQYPPRYICWKCNTRNAFTEVRLNPRGKIFTFTKDYLVPTPNPPVVMVTVDLEGGGRFYAQMTDCEPDQVHIGMEVELTFRKLHEGEGYPNYFWKFRPVMTIQGSESRIQK